MKNYVDAKALQEYTTKLVAKLKTLFPGTPTAAATVAEMTDHSKTYVYVGTESGYTAGDWYYWNGTAWTSGGPFQATSIITDTTLAVTGEAADAKATGDAIAAAKTAVLNAMAPAYSPSGTYAVGNYVNHNGAIYRCTTAITTAEAWTAGHWTEVPLGTDLADQVGALKESLDILDTGSATTTTKALTKGRFYYQYNSIGNTPSIDASAGKYCTVDIGRARDGGSIKIVIDSLTSNATIASLITDDEDKITRRWVTSYICVLNAETNKYEWDITPEENEYKIYFSIYGGSDSCTVVSTPSYSLKSVNDETKQNTADINELTDDVDDLGALINANTTTATGTLTKGRYIYSSNPVGSVPVQDSTGGKYCIIDTGIALNGGTIKISIDSITSNQTVSTLLTDKNDKITERWVSYDSVLPVNKFIFNSETNKFESTFEIANETKLYVSINGGSDTCTINITPPEIGVKPETYYVSSDGSDENSGLKSTHPFATLAKALSMNAKNIHILSDIYEDVVINNSVSIYGNGYTIYGDTPLTVSAYSSIVRAPFAADTLITNCVVNKTTPLTETVSGSEWKGDRYNICVYADDEKLLPVDSILDCESTPNTFTWADGYFYINATATRYAYCNKSNIITVLSGSVVINNLIAKHAYSDIISASNCALEMNGCIVCGSVNFNCISMENGELVARNVEVEKSWNDGINTHGRGNSTIVDCYCHDCSDDGISQHDNTTGTIIGGEFCRCGKGGISSPINSAKVDIYNAYVHDNDGSASYGIYASNSSGVTQTVRIWNCVIKDNRIGLKIVGHQILAYGNKLSGNTTNVSTESGGTVTYLD